MDLSVGRLVISGEWARASEARTGYLLPCRGPAHMYLLGSPILLLRASHLEMPPNGFDVKWALSFGPAKVQGPCLK